MTAAVCLACLKLLFCVVHPLPLDLRRDHHAQNESGDDAVLQRLRCVGGLLEMAWPLRTKGLPSHVPTVQGFDGSDRTSRLPEACDAPGGRDPAACDGGGGRVRAEAPGGRDPAACDGGGGCDPAADHQIQTTSSRRGFLGRQKMGHGHDRFSDSRDAWVQPPGPVIRRHRFPNLLRAL